MKNVFLLLAGVFIIVNANAQKIAPDAFYYLLNAETGQVLSPGPTLEPDSFALVIRPFTKDDKQRWMFLPSYSLNAIGDTVGTTYSIFNRNTGHYISINTDNNIVMDTSKAAAAAQWRLTYLGDNQWTILHTKVLKYLAINGDKIDFKSSYTSILIYYAYDVPEFLLPKTVYAVMDVNTGLAVSIDNSVNADVGQLYFSDYAENKDQLWTLIHVEDDKYVLKNAINKRYRINYVLNDTVTLKPTPTPNVYQLHQGDVALGYKDVVGSPKLVGLNLTWPKITVRFVSPDTLAMRPPGISYNQLPVKKFDDPNKTYAIIHLESKMAVGLHNYKLNYTKKAGVAKFIGSEDQKWLIIKKQDGYSIKNERTDSLLTIDGIDTWHLNAIDTNKSVFNIAEFDSTIIPGKDGTLLLEAISFNKHKAQFMFYEFQPLVNIPMGLSANDLLPVLKEKEEVIIVDAATHLATNIIIGDDESGPKIVLTRFNNGQSQKWQAIKNGELTHFAANLNGTTVNMRGDGYYIDYNNSTIESCEQFNIYPKTGGRNIIQNCSNELVNFRTLWSEKLRENDVNLYENRTPQYMFFKYKQVEYPVDTTTEFYLFGTAGGKAFTALDTAANSAILQMGKINSKNYYRWKFRNAGYGLYYITNAQSGMVLQVQDGVFTNKAKIVQSPLLGLDNQKFQVVKIGDNYKIVSRYSNMAITCADTIFAIKPFKVNTFNLVQSSCLLNDTNQLFKLIPVTLYEPGFRVVVNGLESIRRTKDSGDDSDEIYMDVYVDGALKFEKMGGVQKMYSQAWMDDGNEILKYQRFWMYPGSIYAEDNITIKIWEKDNGKDKNPDKADATNNDDYMGEIVIRATDKDTIKRVLINQNKENGWSYQVVYTKASERMLDTTVDGKSPQIQSRQKVLSQGNEGRCTACATVGCATTEWLNQTDPGGTNAVELFDDKKFYKRRLPNANGKQEDGWHIDLALNEIIKGGLPFKNEHNKKLVMNYYLVYHKDGEVDSVYLKDGVIKKDIIEYADGVNKTAGYDKMRMQIKNNHPLLARFYVYDDFETNADLGQKYAGNITTKGTNPDRTPGVHAVFVTGYTNPPLYGNEGPSWTLQNSWGNKFGSKGFVEFIEGACAIDDIMYKMGPLTKVDIE